MTSYGRMDGQSYSNQDMMNLGKYNFLSNGPANIGPYVTSFRETNGPIANTGVLSSYDHTTPIIFDGLNHLSQNMAQRQGGRQTHSHMFYSHSTQQAGGLEKGPAGSDLVSIPLSREPYTYPPSSDSGKHGDGVLISRDEGLMFDSVNLQNEVLDTNKNQGTFDIYDLQYQTRRDLNHRSITIENSSDSNDTVVAIYSSLYYAFDDPDKKIDYEAGEDLKFGYFFPKSFLEGPSSITKRVHIPARSQVALDINTVDTRHQQQVVVLEPHKDSPSEYIIKSSPTILKRTANSFVLRDGLEMWWVEFMRYSR